MKQKTILSVLLALCIALGLMAATAYAADLTTWPGLQEAINLGGTVTLTADVTAAAEDVPLEIPAGKSVTNLAGHTIDRGQSLGRDSIESLAAIHVSGTLNLRDSAGSGKIVGGFTDDGYKGFGVVNEGVFTVSGGTVEGGNDYTAVENMRTGTLTVSGGTINHILNRGEFTCPAVPG